MSILICPSATGYDIYINGALVAIVSTFGAALDRVALTNPGAR